MMRGLLLVEVMRPKSPALPGMIWPVFGLMLPPEEEMALKLLIGWQGSHD